MLICCVIGAQPLPKPGGAPTGAAGGAVNGAYPASLTLRDFPSAKDYGVKANAIPLTSCSVGSGLSAITCTSAAFVSGDVGKIFWIGSSTTYLTTIATVVDSTHITGSSTAPIGYGGHTAIYGTDDTAAWQAAAATGLSIQGPLGISIINGSVLWHAQRLYGHGQETIIQCVNPSSICMQWDYASGATFGGSTVIPGAQDIIMFGPINYAGTNIGIQVGGTLGANGSNFDRLKLTAFATDFKIGAPTIDTSINESFLVSATRVLQISGSGGESFNFNHDFFINGGADVGVTDTSKCIDIEDDTFNANFFGGSIVICQLYVSGQGHVVLDGVHMENATGTIQPYIDVNNGIVEVFAGDVSAENGVGALPGPPEWATVEAGTLNVYSGYFRSGTNPQSLINLSGSGNAFVGKISGAGTFANGLITGTSSGQFSVSNQAGFARGASTSVQTALQTDTIVYCNGGPGGGWNLPATPFDQEQITVKNSTASQTCTVTGNSGNIVYNGASVASVTVRNQTSMTFLWGVSGAQWFVIQGDAILNGPILVRDSSGSSGLSSNQLTLNGGSTFVTSVSGNLNLSSGSSSFTLHPNGANDLSPSADLANAIGRPTLRLSASYSGGQSSSGSISKSGAYTVLTSDGNIEVTATATMTLPAAPFAGETHVISSGTASITVTIAPNGKNINGSASSITMTAQYSTRTLQYNGTEWRIIGSLGI